MRTRSSAFTLIELLVVIAIIAILAAILFPVFVTAKERGRQAVCIANCKQVTAGLLLYADAWGNKIPSCYCWLDPQDSPPKYASIFTDACRPYVKSWSVYLCPSAAPPGRLVRETSWCTSYLVLDVVWNFPDRRFTDLSEFKRPTRTVLFQDGDLQHVYWADPNLTNHDYDNCGDLQYGGAPADHVAIVNHVPVASKKIQATRDAEYKNFCRHNDGSDCGFVDGHVKYVKSGAFTVAMFTK